MSNPLISLIFKGLLALGLSVTPLFGAEAYYSVVKRVIDGDTLLMTDGTRIRLIGVDTPEHHKSKKLTSDAKNQGVSIESIQEKGKKATKMVKNWVENKPVLLEFDTANNKIGHRDRYGRLLAYVYFTVNEEIRNESRNKDKKEYKEGFLNEMIVWSGLGTAYTKYPFQYKQKFKSLETSARQNNRGFWSD